MKRLIVASLVILCLAAPAEAQFGRLLPPRDGNQGFKSGDDVLRLCAAEDETQLLECPGFLEGVSDIYMQERADAGKAPCYPTNQGRIDQIAIQQNFIAFLIAHRERRPEQGSKLMRDSIIARWCAN